MRKIFNKIICFTVAAVSALGVFSLSACGNTHKSKALEGDYSGEVSSNGGFAVEKGNYIYFINGKEDNTADNTYGKVEKGAIMRISKTDLAARNYSSVQTVVPQIAYSGNSNAGIFVYGDYIYYATPSTEKNSDGEIQNSKLEFKSTKLDGTESMKNFYAQSTDNTIEYRYVLDGDDVYLLYVTKGESLYGEETGVSNIHSVNTRTNEDTLLAYNVDSVTFDSGNVTNPRIYYTMNVTDFELGTTSSKYNQIYTVTASAERKFTTGAKDYTEYLTKAFEDDEDGYDPDKDPKYVNCGTLVFDGIGKTESVTPLNGEGADKVERSSYKYGITDYQSGNIFYTRTSSSFGSSSGTSELYNLKQSDVLASEWKPVENNVKDEDYFAEDSSASFTYIFDGEKINEVFISNSNGLIKTQVKDGKVATEFDNKDTFYMMQDGRPTILFIDYTNNYIYYTLSKNANGYSVNGASINRINYTGSYDDYFIDVFPDEELTYLPVCVLNVDAAVDWYQPEMFDGQILFPSLTENMSDYGYIMACDLRGEDGKILDNAGIKALNEKYQGVLDKIDEVDATVYENLPNAYRYGFFANESDYIDELIAAYVKIKDYDEQHFWSNESLAKFKDYVAVKGDWAEYAEDTVKVNGSDIAANKRDYYYAVIGKMTDEDMEAYTEVLKTNYLQPYPEKDPTWFETLSDGEKAGFIIGVIVGGLAIIAAAVVIPLVIKKRKNKMPVYKKQRIKVDTTDDKDIDVYSDGQEQ